MVSLSHALALSHVCSRSHTCVVLSPSTNVVNTMVPTFILDPVYKIYIGWLVPAKDPVYITFEARFQHQVKYTRGK